MSVVPAVTDEPTILWKSADHLIAQHGNVMFQIRSGELDGPALDRVEGALREFEASTEGLVGMMSVLEASATVAGGTVRARQRALIRAHFSELRCHVAVAVLGEGVTATLMRSVARLMVPGQPRISMVASVEEASRWLAPRIERSATDLCAIAEALRRRDAP